MPNVTLSQIGKSAILCACGCGNYNIISKHFLYRSPPRYISGHNTPKGIISPWLNTIELRKRDSETKKRLYKLGLLYIPSYKGHISTRRRGEMVICKSCGKEFYNPLDRKKEGKGIFCSRSCYAKDQKARIMPLETRQKISDFHKGKMPKNIMRPGKFCNVRRGHYNINNKDFFFRSKWEANYALYLDFLVKQGKIIKWEYEVDVFIFEKIKFGTRSFRPDFKIFNNDGTVEYHEVKGWMNAKSKTKLNRMRIYYPDIKLRLIDSKPYLVIKRQVGKLLGFF